MLSKLSQFVKVKRSGFTLIELLVVIAIIGILAGITLTAFGRARAKARDIRRIQELKQIQTALELRFSTRGNYDLFWDPFWICGIVVSPCFSTEDRDAITPGIQWVPPLGGNIPLDPLNNDDYNYVLFKYNPGPGESECYFLMAGLERTSSNLPEENSCVSGWAPDCKTFFPDAVDCVTFNNILGP